MWNKLVTFVRNYKHRNQICLGLGLASAGGCFYYSGVLNPISNRRRFLLPPLSYQIKKGNEVYDELVMTLRGERKYKDCIIVTGDTNLYVAEVEKGFKNVLDYGIPNLIESQQNKFRLGSRHLKRFNKVVKAQDFRLVIADHSNPHAHSYCGGGIYVSNSFYQRYALLPDETLVTICHEIGHNISRHLCDDIIIGNFLFWTCFAANIFLSFVLARNADAFIHGAFVRSLLLFPAYEYGWKLPRSRRNEREADLVGFYLFAASGYHPKLALSSWGKIIGTDKTVSPYEGWRYWHSVLTSTHPNDWDRKLYLIDHSDVAYELYVEAKRKEAKRKADADAC